ncbi:DUF1836 domain-containing protein [Bacillus massilinigeriensis]|uniref:DUF1836 domain-containing protein n=1 Tax=Bacillus massilionigeriensis TaxID=1805475 RepID=UPI00096AEC35|nr:DUF1836 domain-containing protein [Bacillus massilionigeriensis]
MENIHHLIEDLGLENQITLEDIPDIDLYMDQVIQLFENIYSGSKRDSNEKVLTKTMINNYAKGKLFIPIKNKKYSKDHLILISLIYQLKGVLSINDIKSTLDGVNKRFLKGNLNLEELYDSYLNLAKKNANNFKEDIIERANESTKEVMNWENNESDYFKRFLLIASLVNISNLYRRAAEKLVDQLVEEENEK